MGSHYVYKIINNLIQLNTVKLLPNYGQILQYFTILRKYCKQAIILQYFTISRKYCNQAMILQYFTILRKYCNQAIILQYFTILRKYCNQTIILQYFTILRKYCNQAIILQYFTILNYGLFCKRNWIPLSAHFIYLNSGFLLGLKVAKNSRNMSPC